MNVPAANASKLHSNKESTPVDGSTVSLVSYLYDQDLARYH